MSLPRNRGRRVTYPSQDDPDDGPLAQWQSNGLLIRGFKVQVLGGSPRPPTPAKVAELADAPDLGSGGATHGGSTPPFRTSFRISESRRTMAPDDTMNQAHELQVEVSDVSPARKSLRIAVPAGEVAAEYDKALRRYARSLSVPGFRQ